MTTRVSNADPRRRWCLRRTHVLIKPIVCVQVGHQAWFWAHDQTRFDVVLFALSENDDSTWWRNNSAMVPPGNFVELGRPGSGISPGDLAERINRRNVHVLVTLNGWTSGNQIDSLAMRPAALQV